MPYPDLIHPSLLIPEIALCGLIVLLFVLDLTLKGTDRRVVGTIAVWGLLSAFLLALCYHDSTGTTFRGAYVNDAISLFFKGFFLLCATIVATMGREYAKRFERGVGEFFILICIATLGMMMLTAITNLLVLFVALEVTTVSFYVLTAFHPKSEASLEAGTKYLILGAFSSAILLYGMSFLYGATGSVEFSVIATAVSGGNPPVLAILGLVLVLSGIGFKIACVPFHLWVPDVYQGAPTPVTAYLSVGSKAAGFVILLRLLLGMFGALHAQWSILIAVLAAMTIFYGNLGALSQTNFKRLLGYSSIGHAGYVLIGVAAGTTLGVGAVVFYLTVYLFTNLAVFLVLIAVTKDGPGEEINRLAGLSKRAPFLAAAMFVALLSLAGVPPLGGFTAKFLLLLSAVESDMIWLALIGAVNVVISLYYYLMIINTMYFKEVSDSSPLAVRKMTRVAIAVCLAGILGLGIVGEPFVKFAMAAVSTVF